MTLATIILLIITVAVLLDCPWLWKRGWHYHDQDLRDGKWEAERYLWHKRGWLDRYVTRRQANGVLVDTCRGVFRWCATIPRRPESDMHCTVSFGGEDHREVQFHFSLLGYGVILTFPCLLPDRLSVGWYSRVENGVEMKNPRWFDDSHGRQYGVYYFHDALVLQWNKSNMSSGGKGNGISKFLYAPWSWEHVRSEVLLPDGTLVKRGDGYEPPYADGRRVWQETYRYVLRNGKVQDRVATIYVDEMEWRWRFFARTLGWKRFGPKLVRRSINVTFSEEVGERSGSWKGGCTGCGYELLHGEDPIDCLRRMERERKFT